MILMESCEDWKLYIQSVQSVHIIYIGVILGLDVILYTKTYRNYKAKHCKTKITTQQYLC